MNNFAVLKEISNIFENAPITALIIIIFILLNLFLSCLQIWSQFKIKKIEKEVHRANIINVNKIKVLELIFKEMQELTILTPKNNDRSFLKKITNLERIRSKNRLYIDKNFDKIIIRFSDYCKGVLTNIRLKNIVLEEELLDDFKKQFNK